MNDRRKSRFDAIIGEMFAGGLAGAATGDPAGAAVGAATPVAVRGLVWGVREFRERVLGHREEIRVVEAITIAKERIDERLASGDLPRSDEFFNSAETDRSGAEELLEGVLLAAQREYEERKVRCYGKLYANIAFEPAIDRVTAISLLREADELSYTQIQLLALVARQEALPLPQTSEGSGGSVSWIAASVRNALDDLGYSRRELVAARRQPGELLPTDLGVPADLELTPRGHGLYVLMELDQMKSPEFARLWHRYDVRAHTRGRKSFHHPDVGDLDLDLGYQSMSLNGTPGQALIAYYAEPGTAEHDALTLLDRADIDQHQNPSQQPAPIDAPHAEET